MKRESDEACRALLAESQRMLAMLSPEQKAWIAKYTTPQEWKRLMLLRLRRLVQASCASKRGA
jgi:hypothetical protein